MFAITLLITATIQRSQLIDYFDKGMEYYEAENYEEALKYFDDLVNWKIGERNGKEMYIATLQQLSQERTIYICQWCGHIVDIEDSS